MIYLLDKYRRLREYIMPAHTHWAPDAPHKSTMLTNNVGYVYAVTDKLGLSVRIGSASDIYKRLSYYPHNYGYVPLVIWYRYVQEPLQLEKYIKKLYHPYRIGKPLRADKYLAKIDEEPYNFFRIPYDFRQELDEIVKRWEQGARGQQRS